ncbi:cytochrome c oxidase assembly protein [Halobacillus salinarum]|uniref:Cytochrome c oxidase assembly protein n=1 Tax=Halobacillus salinarum TaxID=2932257 RepID=A0ABY4END5_9BACI|nr:cytochrome c oxidase assembly protein [Halobacillus salinarum]UOQ45968.1 cytochrome c oxidase assembly protein [Halobacillus salinarum]
MADLLWIEARSSWNLLLVISTMIMAILYTCFVRRVKQKVFDRRGFLFFLGLFLTALLLGTPLTLLSHITFTFHMIQMSVILFVVPLLLLLGMPEELRRRMRKRGRIFHFIKWSVSAKLSLILFSALLFIYHLPFGINAAFQLPGVHAGCLAVLFLLALHMWTPLAFTSSKTITYRRYTHWSSLLIMPSCFLFIVYAVIGGLDNPLLNQILANLCVPSKTISHQLIPFQINPRLDQFLAGAAMACIHKSALMMAGKLNSKIMKN